MRVSLIGTLLAGMCLCGNDGLAQQIKVDARFVEGLLNPDKPIDPMAVSVKKGDVAIELEAVVEGLAAPVWLTHAPGVANRLYVVDQVGLVRVIADGVLVPEPMLDVRRWMIELNPLYDERGFFGLAFHPDFSKPDRPGYGLLYTYTSEPRGPSDYPLTDGSEPDHISVVAEWRVRADRWDVVDPGSRRVLLSFDQPQFNHNGGTVLFGFDGLLYIGTGDGGMGYDSGTGHAPQGNGQDVQSPNGKVLRIDPLGLAGKQMSHGRYSVPPDNPYVGREGLDEIYALGLRNPWRMSFDRENGRLIAGDVGQVVFEEINVIELGGNYGWPTMEAEFYVMRSGVNYGKLSPDPPRPDLPLMKHPAAKYSHDGTIMSVTGGFVYRGTRSPQLRGRYLFGDWSQPGKEASGKLFYADLNTAQVREFILGKKDRPLDGYVLGFGEDAEGEVYLLTSSEAGPSGASGRVRRIVALP